MSHDWTISDEAFSQLIDEVWQELPKSHTSKMDNVAITIADVPDEHQRQKIHLRGDQLLFGLYEGIPLTQRGASYNLVLPDKITLFKLPLMQASWDDRSFRSNVKHTLWHEIAHHFGLDHDRIRKLENQ